MRVLDFKDGIHDYTLRHNGGQKYTTAVPNRPGNFEQFDLFVQNVPCCSLFESNTISKSY